MTEYNYRLWIPKDRVAVLIGKKGEVKKHIESETKTKILVDSKESDVSITGTDALTLLNAREIIKAIGRGFNPDIANLLIKQDFVLEIINISDYLKSKTQLQRLKGRVIGTEGKSRRIIENLTDTNISVYGKTISIIGRLDNVTPARKAIDSLLSGSQHSNVYKWLERHRTELKRQEILGTKSL